MKCHRCDVDLDSVDKRYYVDANNTVEETRSGFLAIHIQNIDKISGILSELISGIDTVNNTVEQWVSEEYSTNTSEHRSYIEYVKQEFQQQLENAETTERQESLKDAIEGLQSIDEDISWSDIELEPCMSFDNIEGNPEDNSNVIGRISAEITIHKEVKELICGKCKKSSDDVIWEA